MKAADEVKADKAKTALDAIEGVYLRGRTLRFANFSESRLYGADLVDLDLSYATLRLTNLTGANLTGADLTRADLSYADLTDASGLLQDQLAKACGTGTKPPSLRQSLKPCPKDG